MMKYFELFITFMKIGAFSFGGGLAMIPFFEREIVSHHWVSSGNYTKLIAIAQIVPGPFAIDSSAYIGNQAGGLLGAALASIALCLPSFLLLIIITKFYVQFKTNQYIQLTLKSVRPAVMGLLISSAYIIGLQPLIGSWNNIISFTMLKAAVFILGGYTLLKLTKINPIAFIGIFAVIGILFF
jgi:chromate transporter